MGAHGPGSLQGKEGKSGKRGQRGVVNAYFLFPAHSPTPLIDPVERLISCFIAARAMEFLNNFALFAYSSARVWEATRGVDTGARAGGRLASVSRMSEKKRGSRRLAKQNERRLFEGGVGSNVNYMESGGWVR